MDVFVTLAQAKLDLKCTNEELSWLQTLFEVVCDINIDASTVPCNEICLRILNIVMSANGNCIPTNHLVLTVKDMCNFANNDCSFVGSIGIATSTMAESSQNISGFTPLNERNVILIGYLTASPNSRTSLIPGAGLLYLEDKKNAMICQVCKPERHMLNKLVLLPRWNFISCSKFPVVIFEGDTSEAGSFYKFCYLEVIKDCLCIGEKNHKSVSDVPKALSVGDYTKMESKLEKLNLRGCLVAVSPIHRFMQNHLKGKPFFIAKLECKQTQYSTVVIFQGERFTHWHNFFVIGETFVISNVLETTMNKGQPSERKVLATTRNSDFIKEEQHTSTSVSLKSSLHDKTTPSEEKKRKRDKPSHDSSNTEQVKRFKVETQSCNERTAMSIVTHSSKSETFWCSPPMAYQGVITAVTNIGAGVYEVDSRMKLYTHYQPCTNFGCGMRVGALVSLHNVHLCKLNKEVLGFSCCTYSTIEVVRHSKLSSPFKALVPSINNFYRIYQRLALVQFIRFLELIDVLMKKFQPTLSRSDVIGGRNILSSSNSPKPTMLSHVLNLDSLATTSSRDIYKEFFGNPHSCLVSSSTRKQTIPKPLTLLDMLNVIDHLGTQNEVTETCSWHCKEITKDEISKDMVLIGWLSSCGKTCQLQLCDETAKILCLIVETETSKIFHKCTSSCLQERNTTQSVIVAFSDTKENGCPLVHTPFVGAIFKIESFKIVIESFFGQEQDISGACEKGFLKSYLVFSLRHAQVIGRVPGIKILGISTRRRKAKKGEEDPEVTNERCFLFLLKSKELMSLDLKENTPSLTSCVQGYLLGEVKGSDRENTDDFNLESFKKSIIIRFEKHLSALAFLHPGCLYLITDSCDVDKTSTIQKALDLKGMCPVMQMSSKLRFEQIDRRSLYPNIYEEWTRLSARCLKINSVRESLCKQNQTEKQDSKGPKPQPEPLLVSFRGLIVNRESVISNQSDDICPFPTIPNGKIYLPHYGLISRSQALALSLGFCFLGTRQLVLTVRDVETADTVKVYMDLCTISYPCGMVPGAVVIFRQVSNHTSRKGNIYFSFKACSNIIVESFSSESSACDNKVSRLPETRVDSSATQVRHLIDFSICQRNDEVIPIVAYVICRVTAVQKVIVKWTCSRCGKLVNECYCLVDSMRQTWIFVAHARCLVEDGTSEAVLYVENDHVKDLLLTTDTSWNEIKDLSRKQGELWYQRSAYWKNIATGSETRADTILSNIASSSDVFRRIKILCKQFRHSNLDNVGKEKMEDHETRTVTVDRNEHSTYILGKVTLNVLDVKEVNNKQEASRLMKIITENITKQ